MTGLRLTRRGQRLRAFLLPLAALLGFAVLACLPTLERAL